MRRSQLSDLLLIAALCLVVAAALYVLFTSLGASPLITLLILGALTVFTGAALINAARRRWSSSQAPIPAPDSPSPKRAPSGLATFGLAMFLLGSVMVFGLFLSQREAQGALKTTPTLEIAASPTPAAAPFHDPAATKALEWLSLPLAAVLLGSLTLALAIAMAHQAGQPPAAPGAEPGQRLSTEAEAPAEALDWSRMLAPDDDDEGDQPGIDAAWWVEQLSRDDDDKHR